MNAPANTLRSLTGRRRGRTPLRLAIVPMIDIVFLLLVFFLVTASFRGQEGFLPAELPRRVEESLAELEPLEVRLACQPQGGTLVQIGGDAAFLVGRQPGESFDILGVRLVEVLASQGRTTRDPVKLIPEAGTKWEQVVQAYDVLWRRGLSNVIFAIVEE